jgi:hypothetical protein
VPVLIERHRGRGVAEHLLHHLDVGAGRDGQAGCGVSKLLWMQARPADLRSGCIERRFPEARSRGKSETGFSATAPASDAAKRRAKPGKGDAPGLLRVVSAQRDAVSSLTGSSVAWKQCHHRAPTDHAAHSSAGPLIYTHKVWKNALCE